MLNLLKGMVVATYETVSETVCSLLSRIDSAYRDNKGVVIVLTSLFLLSFVSQLAFELLFLSVLFGFYFWMFTAFPKLINSLVENSNGK